MLFIKLLLPLIIFKRSKTYLTDFSELLSTLLYDYSQEKCIKTFCTTHSFLSIWYRLFVKFGIVWYINHKNIFLKPYFSLWSILWILFTDVKHFIILYEITSSFHPSCRYSIVLVTVSSSPLSPDGTVPTALHSHRLNF